MRNHPCPPRNPNCITPDVPIDNVYFMIFVVVLILFYIWYDKNIKPNI